MIPKTIHYCWFGGNPLPDLAQKCIESWRRFCPDYEIIRWDESNYDINKNRYMKEAYDSKKWGFVPDYARLDIIYEHGGIYLDTDVEIIKPIDTLLNYKAFCGIEDPSNTIALGLGFGAEPKNRIIQSLRDDYKNRKFILNDGQLNLLAAPGINTKKLCELGCVYDKKEITTFFYGESELTIFPKEYFCPKDFVTGELCITEKTYAIHHYDGSWTSERWKWRSKFIQKYYKLFGKTGARYLSFLLYCVKTGDLKNLWDKIKKKLNK